MKFGTKAVHAGLKPDESTGAIMTPIYQTSTYAQKMPGDHKGYEYSRTLNPTRDALQRNLAAIENGKYGLCFSSGMGAIDTVVKLLSPGDEIVANNDLYGGTYRIMTKVFEGYGIKSHFVDMSDASSVAAHINENTKLVWIETPSNPLLNVIDIDAIAALTQGKDILLGVDNTFASPYLQNPLDLGADIVMHSVTKYLGGHSDVVMGALICSDDDLHERLSFIQNTCGAVPGPQDCFLVLRGIKTLHLRMQRHSDNGRTIAEYLDAHDKVARVYWPGLESHANHDIAKKQMRDFGGMLSFTLKDNSLAAAHAVISQTKIFILAESLGGVESLVGHPASMTHAAIPQEKREATGIVEGLIRLSIGIEDSDDLVEDLKQAIG
ncbi:MAG: cystathionine gamma-synthase [Flavobacteriales bacterium]|nr:cystathionine gamma-synthase [Flavobacteriales bacterium]